METDPDLPQELKDAVMRESLSPNHYDWLREVHARMLDRVQGLVLQCEAAKADARSTLGYLTAVREIFEILRGRPTIDYDPAPAAFAGSSSGIQQALDTLERQSASGDAQPIFLK